LFGSAKTKSSFDLSKKQYGAGALARASYLRDDPRSDGLLRDAKRTVHGGSGLGRDQAMARFEFLAEERHFRSCASRSLHRGALLSSPAEFLKAVEEVVN
jgi:hypothetical protein